MRNKCRVSGSIISCSCFRKKQDTRIERIMATFPFGILGAQRSETNRVKPAKRKKRRSKKKTRAFFPRRLCIFTSLEGQFVEGDVGQRKHPHHPLQFCRPLFRGLTGPPENEIDGSFLGQESEREFEGSKTGFKVVVAVQEDEIAVGQRLATCRKQKQNYTLVFLSRAISCSSRIVFWAVVRN